ncbi:sulfoxide reductase heme-binding subunit YedZ [Mergibacter septicus]|uniref:Sulfoxide reductase heme-binding subunit YedZ n=1 Tax=Mergibacter septicus TaxID=221402 RepID=A0A8D4J056_9PAST|nr:ferric reductase-like transmembrane domain-containing protein [Mergibacter septicus]AWX15507.1 sulfoxide reductase heme-binding subunit YedZ [Mergibacter septicus]QDJ12984.1 sulfoxide reductase heme-binding subunit YedZ [Mergibacter septicus]QDJ14761.1 sulfoxide reductase heme-binding subunit YedZ [Mergibacter septicus]UTU47810.1 ferric reductase-like transmembrane domain-containing protein [Mergibacter septicus]WMR96582.1 ferric reductase-like transmembrane domain-containing protein [Mergi
MKKLLQITAHLGAFLPLCWLIYALNFNLEQSFGTDPGKEIIHYLGWVAICLFIILFFFRIVDQIFQRNDLLILHRAIGLWALFWLTLHIVAYFLFELGFDFSLFIKEVTERFYLQIGLISAVLFLLIAISSIPFIRRKLGDNWFLLHQCSLIALVLAAVHYYLSLKSYDFYSVFFLASAAVFVLWKMIGRKLLKWLGLAY